jgi:methylated-DNA-[protein]-cysteine S-methyltransferase
MERFTLFDTAIGRCAIVWGRRGIRSVELPGRDDTATRRRITKSRPGAQETAPPPQVEHAITAITELFDGGADDLHDVVLDVAELPEFDRRVYDATRAITPGSTSTYGAIAAQIGEPGSAQAVGQALGRNPIPIIVPCHRVVAADGSMRGFSAPGGIATKRRMLALEGALEPALFD